MGKSIELTVEIKVQKVSCPGVWLCQDGRVSLTIFALGTSYQTSMLPPVFPLIFNDVFYFRKRFPEACAMNNICCLLENETIYCELVQWCQDCASRECVILAQYLGAVNDVLFPSNMCSNEGIDLLMRRSKEFPGILAPKIEVTTKVRIDEISSQSFSTMTVRNVRILPCTCKMAHPDVVRQKQVCHSPIYHRIKCTKRSPSNSRSRSRSRSGSRSCQSLSYKDEEIGDTCLHSKIYSDSDKYQPNYPDDRSQRVTLESRYMDQEIYEKPPPRITTHVTSSVTPCVCEICKMYHAFFHADLSS